MTAKEYLQQAYKIDMKLKTKKMELEQLRLIPLKKESKSFTSGERKRNNSPHDPVADIYEKIEAYENEVNEEIKKLIITKNQISRRIGAMPDDKLRLILQKRYLTYQIWDDIADDLGKDYRYIYRMHNKALKEFGERWHKEIS
jgi:hypothetical protein